MADDTTNLDALLSRAEDLSYEASNYAGTPDDLAGVIDGLVAAVREARKTIVIVVDSGDYDRRMAQAHARSGWTLGDPSWADMLVDAFLNPEKDAAALADEMGDDA